MLKLYGYMKCSTCRNAMKWLEAAGHSPAFIDITVTPPSQALLKKLLAAGYSLKQLFNTSGILYREMKIKDKITEITEADAVKLLAAHGKLCKRPIVTDGKQYTVGFKEQTFQNTWS